MVRTTFAAVVVVVAAVVAETRAVETISVRVTNPISIARSSETISVDVDRLRQAMSLAGDLQFQVRDADGQVLVTQSVDLDGDGVANELLFQADFGPDESRAFTVSPAAKAVTCSTLAYAAYVPGEGLEDLAWENDLIGYRYYGQARSVEQGTGTAIDVWCKRVHYPMTHEWYDPNINYHRDTGRGADHYSAGKNQGCGGSGMYVSGKVYLSRPFSDWKIITTGPIRVIFELKFTGWQFGSVGVVETKRVSLDTGHFLNRFESTYSLTDGSQNVGTESLPRFSHAVGLVLRESSRTQIVREEGWIGGWESLGRRKGELGTCVIAAPEDIQDVKEVDGHLYTLLSSGIEKRVTYHAGAAWSEYGPIASFEAWKAYVGEEAQRIANPCIVQLVNPEGGD